MKKKILVIGASGLIGKAVANQLKKDDYYVIVMSRNMEKTKQIFPENYEIIEANVLYPESIKYAFSGVDGVFISLPEKDVPAAITNILHYAKESGVGHIVYTSGCTVRKENAWHPMINGHYQGEQAIEKSRIPFTIFKLTMVMDMIPRYANNGKPFIVGKQNHGWSWIYSGDIAKMASKAFSNEAAKNKKFTIFGKEKCTIAEAVDQYHDALNISAKPAKPKSYWLANLLALMVGEKLKYAISIFKYFETHPEEGDPTEAYEILGEPEMDLAIFFEYYKKCHSSKK